MLKRASVTLYLAQESDTFGKDSELASTLAQGKPVVAYVPDGSVAFAENLLADLALLYPHKTKKEILLEQLEVFDSHAAWCNSKIWHWLEHSDQMDENEAKLLLFERIREHYDRRARLLKEQHPLGIQMVLQTGVANGVLVVRTILDCIELIYRLIIKTMEFELESKTVDGRNYILLNESISGSPFRVVTGHELLTNTFWNFYLHSANQ